MPASNTAVIEFDAKEHGFCYQAAFQADGKVLSASFGGGKQLWMGKWDVEKACLLEKVEIPEIPGNDHFLAMEFSPRETFVALRFWNYVAVLDSASYKSLFDIRIRDSYPECVAWSADESRLGIGAQGMIHSVDCDEGRIIRTIKFYGKAKAIGFRSSDEIMVGLNSEIRIWRVGGPSIGTITHLGDPGRTWNHAVSETWTGSASDKGDLVLTAVEDGAQQRFVLPKNGPADVLKFSMDRTKLAIGYANGTVVVWDIKAGRELLRWKKPHYSNVNSLDFGMGNALLLCVLDHTLFVLDFREGARSKPVIRPKLPAGMVRSFSIWGSEHYLDRKGEYRPLNALPTACTVCHFPDLDHVPQPYLLGKGFDNPVEITDAEVGNLLVRKRVKEILELAAPGQCRFYSTQKAGRGELTEWYLAVPLNQLQTGTVKQSIPRCPACGEPLHAHGTQYEQIECSPISRFDVFKSSNWGSIERPVSDLKGWVDRRHALSLRRECYLSFRLGLLLKKLGVRGDYRYRFPVHEEGDTEEIRWANKQFEKLKNSADDVIAEQKTAWLDGYLAKTRRKEKSYTFEEIEKEAGCVLPASYKKFVRKLAGKIF
jgi:hypothetical protein